MSSNETSSILERNHFVLRRLHSLCGIVPVGVFLFPHLTTNSSIVWGSWLGKSHLPAGTGHAGVEMFQHEVNFIHALPALILIEIFILWLPIAFHAIFGVYFGISGQPNVKAYRYSSNWRYTLQRLTGYLGVIFIFMHISSFRWGWSWFGLFPEEWAGDYAASTTADHFQMGGAGRSFIVSAFYLVAVLGLVYHFANGLWTAAITWGVTVTTDAQKRWGYVCGVVGLGLAAATVLSVVGFSSLDINEARRVEQRMLLAEGKDEAASHMPAAIVDAPEVGESEGNDVDDHGDDG